MQQTPQSRKRPQRGMDAQAVPVTGSIALSDPQGRWHFPTFWPPPWPIDAGKEGVRQNTFAATQPLAHGHVAQRNTRRTAGVERARARAVRTPQGLDHWRTGSSKQLGLLASPIEHGRRVVRSLFSLPPPCPCSRSRAGTLPLLPVFSASFQFGLLRETPLKPYEIQLTLQIWAQNST